MEKKNLTNTTFLNESIVFKLNTPMNQSNMSFGFNHVNESESYNSVVRKGSVVLEAKDFA